jgi:hypothetical protein
MFKAVAPFEPRTEGEPICIHGAVLAGSVRAVSERQLKGSGEVCLGFRLGTERLRIGLRNTALHAQGKAGARFPLSRKIECLHSAVPTLVGVTGSKLQPLQRLHRQSDLGDAAPVTAFPRPANRGLGQSQGCGAIINKPTLRAGNEGVAIGQDR